jgi:hypothetical protein
MQSSKRERYTLENSESCLEKRASFVPRSVVVGKATDKKVHSGRLQGSVFHYAIYQKNLRDSIYLGLLNHGPDSRARYPITGAQGVATLKNEPFFGMLRLRSGGLSQSAS